MDRDHAYEKKTADMVATEAARAWALAHVMPSLRPLMASASEPYALIQPSTSSTASI